MNTKLHHGGSQLVNNITVQPKTQSPYAIIHHPSINCINKKIYTSSNMRSRFETKFGVEGPAEHVDHRFDGFCNFIESNIKIVDERGSFELSVKIRWMWERCTIAITHTLRNVTIATWNKNLQMFCTRIQTKILITITSNHHCLDVQLTIRAVEHGLDGCFPKA